jgi:hypothetical protein
LAQCVELVDASLLSALSGEQVSAVAAARTALSVRIEKTEEGQKGYVREFSGEGHWPCSDDFIHRLRL